MLERVRLRSRRKLLICVITLQALMLVVGGIVMYRLIRHSFGQRVEQIVFEHNLKTSESVSRMLERANIVDLTFGTPDWERAQGIVEDLDLSADAFVCVLDPMGNIVCHPHLRENPSLREVNLGAVSLTTESGAIPIGSRAELLHGYTSFGVGGIEYVTARRLKSPSARLLVHQPEAGLIRIEESATGQFVGVALGIGLSVLALTAAATLVSLRRYDSQIEQLNRTLEEEVDRRSRESVERLHSLIFALAKLADYRDCETGAHLERICSYSDILARQLCASCDEIDEDWMNRLHLAASLHDIGKVGIPDNVLLKPGRFTPEERAIMERHPLIGADTMIAVRRKLGDDPLLNMSIEVVIGHHERWDGKGYPYGMAGEDIALSARIVALADVYDALTSKRVYKDAMPHSKVHEIICEGRGTQFDPAVVDAFVECSEEFARVAEQLCPAQDRMAA